uniref:Uncharacterized protein n=1 Tax=Anguilla anguilla TaxID=7936 RepID=A0A0E9PRX7_ANGAN
MLSDFLQEITLTEPLRYKNLNLKQDDVRKAYVTAAPD